MGVPKLPKLGLPRLWSPIILCINLWLNWGLKKSYSPRQEIFNGMSHATCMQVNQVDSWLLMFDPSFDHNLCFKCPNGWYEPILDIYISIYFQWYKKILNPLGFGPCNRLLNIWKSTDTPTPKVEAPLGVWGFVPSHFLSLPSFLSWLATLQALALVMSPRLRLQHLSFLIVNDGDPPPFSPFSYLSKLKALNFFSFVTNNGHPPPFLYYFNSVIALRCELFYSFIAGSGNPSPFLSSFNSLKV